MDMNGLPTISTQPPRNREPRNPHFLANTTDSPRSPAASVARQPADVGPRVRMRVQGGSGPGARNSLLNFSAQDSLAHVIRDAKRQGFPSAPFNSGQPGQPMLQGTTHFEVLDVQGAPLPFTIQIVDLDEMKAKQRREASWHTQPKGGDASSRAGLWRLSTRATTPR